MLIQLIKLYFREATRSPALSKNVIINIFLGLFMLYLLAIFLILALILEEILLSIIPEKAPVIVFNGIILYYFGIELFIRFLMVPAPAMSLTPFLHLPVKKTFLMHFLLGRSVINPLNYISFVIFIPFAIKTVSSYYSSEEAIVWLLSIFLLVVFIIYTSVYIKRQMVIKPVVSLSFGLIFAALFLLDYFNLFSFTELSSSIFGTVMEQPKWLFVPATLVVGIYILNHRLLIARSYPEEIDFTSKKKQEVVHIFGFMHRFGHIGELIALELKLIMRHKRTKSIFYITPIFMFYGLLFYPNPIYDSTGWLLFVGIFITGFAMLTYGTYVIGWESQFFDAVLTRKSSYFDYFRAKYYMLAAFCLVCYILAIPYIYFGIKVFWTQTACFIFNIGINSFIMLWFGLYNRKRMELSKGTAFNWQGTSAANFIVMLPSLFLPMFIALMLSRLGY